MAKRSVTARLETELVERIMNAIWWQGNRTTLTDLLDDCLPAIVRDLERANDGKPYPPREGDLPMGRKRKD